MNIIVGPIVQLLQCTWPTITKCWKNHRGLGENMNKLINQDLAALNSRKADIESRMETELVQGETKLKDEVEHWLRRVAEINVETHSIEENFQNVKCFCRASLGEEVIKKIMQVENLYGAGEFPNGLVITIQQHGEILPTTTIVGGETTFKRKMEEIWAYLMNDEVTKIGVYGMGGIGKTTAMEYLNNSLIQNTNKFDNVFWITVSKESDIISLQHKISRKLQLNFSEHDDETARAAKIYAKFITKRRFVLILDDLWETYSLKNVGIPEPTPENGCKLVMTTRSIEVFCNMDCKPVPINLLSKEEALELFLKIVGPEILSIPNMELIVKDIIHECAGLPLAIVTIAGSLKSKTNCDEIEIALEDLRKSTKGSEGILERLKFSYDCLNDKQLQDCLLYCALFPEDHPIEREKLIQLLIIEGIIEERESRQSQCKKGKLMLNTLVRVCLLNEASDNQLRECLKMHDLVRDMAIEIIKENLQFCVKSGINLKSIPKEQDWKEDLDKVLLMYNNILNIPSSESPKCPKLSTLLLCGNSLSGGIHNNFFLNMEGLNILDLSKTSIEKLPDSIFNLVKLTALLLKECYRLRYVPSLAKLTALRKLDFYGSGIIEAPQGMEMLVKLRYLNFDKCKIETITDKVLCRLINMEYLFFNRQKTKVKGEELAYLKKLKNFEGAFCDGNSFNAYIGSLDDEGPANYILQLGFGDPRLLMQMQPYGLNQSVFSKSVCLYQIETDEGWSLLLPKDVQFLSINYSYFNGRSLCELPLFLNVINLRSCHIKDCKGIHNLLSYPSNTISLLQRLEKMDLEDVPDLQVLIRIEKVASSLLPPDTFFSLKEIRLYNCSKIKKLFMITSLPNLEVITVFECDQLVEIVSVEDQNEEGTDDTSINIITLPKLKMLSMGILPELRSFCSSKKPVIVDSLEIVHIIRCPELKRLSLLDREPCPPSLEKIYIDQGVWESPEWDHPNAKVLLQPLRQTHWPRGMPRGNITF